MATSYPKGASPVNGATPPAAPIDPVTDLLGGGRVVAFRVDLALAVGSTTAGLLLSQFWFWTNTPTTQERDGWFWMTADDISAETGLSREEQMSARKRLRSLGVIEEDKRGVPMKLWFRVLKPELVALLRDYAERKTYLWGKPKDELSGIPTVGEPVSHLLGMPKDNVGHFRKLARGKAEGLFEGIPNDITDTSSPISSPISLNISSEADAPPHKCGPQGEEGEAENEEPVAFLWRQALPIIEAQVHKPTFEAHIRKLTPLSLLEGETGSLITLGVPSVFTRDWVEKRCTTVIEEAVAGLLDHAATVRFEIVGQEAVAHV